MKKIISVLGIVFVIGLTGFVGWSIGKNQYCSLPSSIPLITQKPLEKYSIEALTQTQIPAGNLNIEDELKAENKFTSYLFSFDFDPSLKNKTFKKTTGMINIPKGKGPFPLILMLRGYVDQETYETGVGTRRAAEVFNNNGFLTLAPDFLGYGQSDSQAENVFEARFQTITTALSLLASLDQITAWDKKNLFIWGHSNGGHIALSVLEITRQEIPTSLWAPVSQSFPYSILFYTNELDDKGKYLRRELAKFEDLYDVNDYSIDNYFDQIKADLQIHQGTADQSVPVTWSNQLVEKLKSLKLEVNYYTYSGADHNLQPSWNQVVTRDLDWFLHKLTLK